MQAQRPRGSHSLSNARESEPENGRLGPRPSDSWSGRTNRRDSGKRDKTSRVFHQMVIQRLICRYWAPQESNLVRNQSIQCVPAAATSSRRPPSIDRRSADRWTDNAKKHLLNSGYLIDTLNRLLNNSSAGSQAHAIHCPTSSCTRRTPLPRPSATVRMLSHWDSLKVAARKELRVI